MKAEKRVPAVFQESEAVELKLDYTESIRKDIIAFANTNGGTIYIGIADDGKARLFSNHRWMINNSLLQSLSLMLRLFPIRPD